MIKKLKMYYYLYKEWFFSCLSLGLVPSVVKFVRLVRMYNQPNRHYHNLNHILYCLKTVNEKFPNVKDIYLVKMAIFFHDCVYDIGSRDNEYKSSLEFLDFIKGAVVFNKKDLTKKTCTVCNLIMVTMHHNVDLLAKNAYENRELEQIMCDVDLGIFGATKDDYWRYIKGIWLEYSKYNLIDYAAGRLRFLQGLHPESLFYTSEMKKLAENAKDNLDLEKTVLIERPSFIANKVVDMN